MEIAIASPFHSLGGGESYALNLAKAISKTKNNVTFYTNLPENQSYKTEEHIGNLHVCYVKSKIFAVDQGNPVSTALLKNLLSGNFDVIHVHQMYSCFNLTSSFVGKIKNIPTVLTDHGGGWRLAAIPHICANAPTAFAAVSDFSMGKMIRLAPAKRRKSTVIYGGVNLDELQVPGSSSLIETLPLKNHFVLLCIGRMLAHKGFEVAIKSLRFLPKKTILLIGGQNLDSEYLTYLKKTAEEYAKGQVLFLGAVSASELADLYHVCDVFIQPSLYVDFRGRYHRLSELLGLAKLEAMACGKPVVVSNVGGLPEKIISGKNGFVFEEGNEQALASFVGILLSDDALRRKIGASALQTVKSELTWAKVASNVTDFYSHL